MLILTFLDNFDEVDNGHLLEEDPNKTLPSDSVLCTRLFFKVSSKAGFDTSLVFSQSSTFILYTEALQQDQNVWIIRSVAKIDNEHLNEFGPLNVPLDDE